MLDTIYQLLGLGGIGVILFLVFGNKVSKEQKIEVKEKLDKVEDKIDNNNQTINDVKKEAEDEKAKEVTKEQLVDFFNNWLDKQ